VSSAPQLPGGPPPPVPVLREDPHFLAVFKPPGLVVQGARPEDPSLLARLREWLRVRDAKPGQAFLAPVHRLDRAVCGVVVLAKRSKAASRLSRQIRERTFGKTYVAVVEGAVPAAGGTCRELLAWDDAARRMRVAPPGTPDAKTAELAWAVRERAGNVTVLEIRPVTGRRHQIRVQLAHAGWPVLGDRRYGARGGLPEGIALLSAAITFRHPVREAEEIRVEVPASLDPLPGWLARAGRET
jgi:23S rRNA pseudouridine1911/1915/1917 synthase